MHRVDADGYITVLGNRRFVDRSLPTYEGTVDGAYWNNAVQEEICNVVTYAGLTLRTSGAADESAGWTQLRDAIFSSGKISNAGLANDLDISKCSQGEIDISYGGYAYIMTHDGASFGSGSSSLITEYLRKGINFLGTSSPGSVSSNTRWAIFDISGPLSLATSVDATTLADATVGSHSHIIGTRYILSSLYDIGIPDSVKLFGAMIHNNQSGVRGITGNCQVEFDDTVGGNWALHTVIHHHSTGPDIPFDTSEPIYMTVFFDGSYL